MKYTKIIGALALATVFTLSPSTQAGEKGKGDRSQRGEKGAGERGQKGQRDAQKGQRNGKKGSLAEMLKQVGASPEQMAQIKNAFANSRNSQDRRATIQAELKAILSAEQYKNLSAAMMKARGGQAGRGGQGGKGGQGGQGGNCQK